MVNDLVIYADESLREGKYYSNFYGGALVRSADLPTVQARLRIVKSSLRLKDEVKWIKVTQNYLVKYQQLMDVFFDLIENDLVKVRIMFRQNVYVPLGLNPNRQDDTYFKLYYQFLKHSFGLTYSNDGTQPMRIRVYLDKIPDKKIRRDRFKQYLSGLERDVKFQRANIRIPIDQIAEVDSHNHDIMQCLDVVLGAVQFRLNDGHKVKPAGSRIRGKKTRAKESLYKHIQSRIRAIYTNFNIGESTGIEDERSNHWHHRYRHWSFRPKQHKYDETLSKSWQKKKAP